VEFVQVAPRWIPPPGSQDAVVVVDVLYLLDRGPRGRLIRAALAAAPDGVVVIKEMADHPRWRRRLAGAQEFISVKVGRITAGDTVDLPSEDELLSQLMQPGVSVSAHDLSGGQLHPHLALVARRSDRLYHR
jgi:hypothetical protein